MDFKKYIKNCSILTEEVKLILLNEELDETKKLRIIEILEEYKKNVDFQKNLLFSLELAGIKAFADSIKSDFEEKEKKEIEDFLENSLNNI